MLEVGVDDPLEDADEEPDDPLDEELDSSFEPSFDNDSVLATLTLEEPVEALPQATNPNATATTITTADDSKTLRAFNMNNQSPRR